MLQHIWSELYRLMMMNSASENNILRFYFHCSGALLQAFKKLNLVHFGGKVSLRCAKGFCKKLSWVSTIFVFNKIQCLQSIIDNFVFKKKCIVFKARSTSEFSQSFLSVFSGHFLSISRKIDRYCFAGVFFWQQSWCLSVCDLLEKISNSWRPIDFWKPLTFRVLLILALQKWSSTTWSQPKVFASNISK